MYHSVELSLWRGSDILKLFLVLTDDLLHNIFDLVFMQVNYAISGLSLIISGNLMRAMLALILLQAVSSVQDDALTRFHHLILDVFFDQELVAAHGTPDKAMLSVKPWRATQVVMM